MDAATVSPLVTLKACLLLLCIALWAFIGLNTCETTTDVTLNSRAIAATWITLKPLGIHEDLRDPSPHFGRKIGDLCLKSPVPCLQIVGKREHAAVQLLHNSLLSGQQLPEFNQIENCELKPCPAKAEILAVDTCCPFLGVLPCSASPFLGQKDCAKERYTVDEPKRE